MTNLIAARQRMLVLIFLSLLFQVVSMVSSTAAENGQTGDGSIDNRNGADAGQSSTLYESLSLTIDQAVLLALENNPALAIEKINPGITQTYADQIRGEFDPVISGAFDYAQSNGPISPTSDPYEPATISGSASLGAALSQQLPTGMDISVSLEGQRLWSDRYSDRYQAGAGLSVTQALLKGRSLAVNLASLRQAEIQTRISLFELRGFTEALLATVEEKYWAYAVAQHQVAIVKESLFLADIQLKQTMELIRVGRLAETELIAGRAEMALRNQELIEAQSAMEIARLQLLHYLNPPGPDLWNRRISLLTDPEVPDIEIADVKEHIAVAMAKRADLNEARLRCDKGEMEVVKTKNGLLPRLDFFVFLRKTGYADSFGGSIANLFEDGYDVAAGFSFTHPLGNRAAKANHMRSQLSQTQSQAALANLIRLIELDVHSAYINIGRFRRQIEASKATRRLQEEKLRIETEKFHVGRSTNFMVAQAQRDLVRSRISETEAVADFLIALTDLHHIEGSLLERRGVQPVQ